jgi:hypothetical protein
MYKLFKSEIEYFILPVIIVVMLPLSFTFVALNDVKVFTEIYFLKKYFWSTVIGLGIYGLVFIVWSIKKKELRERAHALIPMSVKSISISRWLFGIIPFVFVGFYIELLRRVLPSEQIVFISRINGQLGMMFIALVGIDLIINSWYALGAKIYDKRIVYIVLITIVVLLLSFGVVYSVTNALLKPLSFGDGEIYFFLWGIILSITDAFVFTKRKTFLS